MSQWVRTAPTLDAYKKRLAVWMTMRGPFHAHRVSDLLQVSKQAVWLWVKQYNEGGPDSLDRKGRGGRRRAYLSLEDEKALVDRLQSLVSTGQAKKAKELLPEVLSTVGQKVSVAYVYRLMQRYERKRGLRALSSDRPGGRDAEGGIPEEADEDRDYTELALENRQATFSEDFEEEDSSPDASWQAVESPSEENRT